MSPTTVEIEDRSYSKWRKRPFRLYLLGRSKGGFRIETTIAHFATLEAAERGRQRWLVRTTEEVKV